MMNLKLIGLSCILAANFAIAQNQLTVNVKNLVPNKGFVEVALYNKSDGFLKEKTRFRRERIKVVGNAVQYSFKNLPHGNYAIATYQDENGNGICDRNLLGIPKEGYAFSQNFKPKIAAPNFDDVRLSVNKNTSVSVNMIKN